MATIILSVCTDLFRTEIAISNDYDIFYQRIIDHSKDVFILFETVIEQLPFRRDAIINQLRSDNVDLKNINCVVAEGGLLKPCASGIYAIDKNMVGDLIEGIAGNDVINLGGLLAFTIANMLNIKSYVIDPASVDERSEIAAFSPNHSLGKKSLFHAMINKYLSAKYADSVNKNYDSLNIILCHVNDRSVSVAAHKNGRIIDVNQAYMGYGPMGLCEIGTLPSSDVIDMLFKKIYPKDEVLNLINNKGSAFSYLGTCSYDEIVDSFKNNNKRTKQYLEAMAYQISKEIASHYVTLDGKIDVIILSGKIFSVNRFFKYISKRIESLAPIVSYPKDYSFDAMIYNVLQLEYGNAEIKSY